MNMKYLITALIVALVSLSTVGAVDIDAVNDAIISDNDNNTSVIPDYGNESVVTDKNASTVNNTTKEKVKETALRYLHPDKLKFVAVGNINKLEKQCSKFGNVEIINKIK